VGEPPEVSYNEDSDHGLLNEDRYQCNELNALLNIFLFSQNIGPSAEDGRSLSVFSRIWSESEPIWMVGSLDAFSSTPIMTPNAVDSFTYLYFFVSLGGNSRQFFRDGFLQLF